MRPGDSERYRGGRLLFPAFPGGRWLPVALASAGMALIVVGVVRGEAATTALGAAGLGVVVVGFGLAPLLLGRDGGEEDGDGDPPPHG